MNIKRLITLTAVWFIIIGTLSWAVAMITGNAIPTYIQANQINYGNGVIRTLYTFSVKDYLKQIETALNVPFGDMFYNFPKLPSINLTNVLSAVPNLFIWLLNAMVWWIYTIVLIPTKLILSLPILFLTLTGLDLQKFQIITIIYKLWTLTPEPIPFI